jgi:hypothetical protein
MDAEPSAEDAGSVGQKATVKGRIERRLLPYRVAFFVTALITLALVVTLPFSVKSVVDDILGSATGRVIPVTARGYEPTNANVPERSRDHEPNYTRLHVAVIGIDEVQLEATVRVSGHHRCPDCPFSHRVRLVSITEDDAEAHGLPASAAITLSGKDIAVSETLRLPLRGHPIHYPFDRYQMVLAVAYQRLYPDGRREGIPSDLADDRLFLTFQELLPRNTMSGPVPADRHLLRAGDDPFEYGHAFQVEFERPRYVRILAVMLVVLIAAAAAYSVFLRPLPDLVINSGALVLGVWGIRAILTPASITYMTAVDLALSLVIIFVLGALTIRALMFVHDEAQMRVLRRRHPRPTRGPGPSRTP